MTEPNEGTEEELQEISREAFQGPALLAGLAVLVVVGGRFIHGLVRALSWVIAGVVGAFALWTFGVAVVIRMFAVAMKETEPDR